MSQIYNGSFLLGNTSATTLSAGPGIKLDTSIPGVIGISNDETLLWSGSLTGTAGSLTAQLSEPFTNFEEIRLTMGSTYGSTYSYGTSADRFQVFSPFVGNGQISLYALNFQTNNERNQITLPAGNCVYCRITANNITGYVNRTDINVGEITLTKVVGVNRIAGGN